MDNLDIILFSKYDAATLEQLASQAIREKDYEKLKNISQSHKYNRFIDIGTAANALDLEAVKIILQYTKFTEGQGYESPEMIAFEQLSMNSNMKDRYDWQNTCDLSVDQKFRDILFYMLEVKMSKKFPINYYDIEALKNIPLYHSYHFMNEHYNGKFKLNRDNNNFNEKIRLMDHEVKKNFKSILPQSECLNNEFGPILSRTYSEIISANNAYTIYHDIASSGKTGMAIIKQLNQNIINDDDVVIFFVKNSISYFAPKSNYVEINLDSCYIMAEAIAAHEIAHYIVQKTFHYNTLPDNLCERFNDKESTLQYVGDWGSLRSKTGSIWGFKENKCFDPKISQFIKAYSEATKDILFKVADILKIKDQVAEYTDYIASDLREYLIQSHPIFTLLFLDPSRKIEEIKGMYYSNTLSKETIVHNAIESIMKYPEFKKDLEYDIKVIIMLYELQKQIEIQKTILESPAIQEVLGTNSDLKKQIDSKTGGNKIDNQQINNVNNWLNSGNMMKHIEDLLLTRYLPKIIEKLNLTEEQVYFLSRAADLINRSDYFGFEQEAVVRCVEIDVQSKFTNMPEDILNACDKMNKFWEEYIFPHMDAVN